MPENDNRPTKDLQRKIKNRIDINSIILALIVMMQFLGVALIESRSKQCPVTKDVTIGLLKQSDNP